MADTVPRILAEWLWPFVGCFTASTWIHVPVLVAGAVLCPGRCTVTATLRVMGLDQTASFAVYHRVLSTARWSARLAARQLLLLLVIAFAPQGPVIIALDDTIERRWGRKIRMRGIYRDPVRSSHGHFVKVSGLRWLCVMLLAPIPWAGCIWALPFLSVLAPSERAAQSQGKRHKKLTDQARQALLQTARWLPGRQVIAVADSSFSVIDLLRDVKAHLSVITRLRVRSRMRCRMSLMTAPVGLVITPTVTGMEGRGRFLEVSNSPSACSLAFSFSSWASSAPMPAGSSASMTIW